jgi:hypothetical protein
MSVRPTKDLFDRAWKLFQDGKTGAEIREATGLNESQYVADRWTRQMKADPKMFGGFITGDSETALAAQIVKARDAGQSWGLIFVRCQLPEGRVRRIFKDATAIDSRGLRTGKGGRFVADDPRFYAGADRPKAGTELLPGVPVLNQVPDPEDTPDRKLPKIAKVIGKAKRTRKPAAPKAKPEVPAAE